MGHVFEPISFGKQAEYLQYLKKVPQLSSDYSFVNLFAWAEEYDLSWAWTDDLVWIKQDSPVPCFWAPVGDWHAIDWPKILDDLPEKHPFIRIPEHLLEIMGDAVSIFEVRESRGHWDYIYSVRELIDLKGKRFHKKKNLLRQFQKKYAVEYIPLDKNYIMRVLKMQFNWCAWKNCEASAGLSAENRVISKVLEIYDSFRGMLGGALVVDNDIIAFTVAEMLDDENIVIHFEKGMDGYKGVYQAINQMFLANNSEFKKVNREQDLNNEGLRKAKLSYNPVDFIKKFELHWR